MPIGPRKATFQGCPRIFGRLAELLDTPQNLRVPRRTFQNAAESSDGSQNARRASEPWNGSPNLPGLPRTFGQLAELWSALQTVRQLAEPSSAIRNLRTSRRTVQGAVESSNVLPKVRRAAESSDVSLNFGPLDRTFRPAAEFSKPRRSTWPQKGPKGQQGQQGLSQGTVTRLLSSMSPPMSARRRRRSPGSAPCSRTASRLWPSARSISARGTGPAGRRGPWSWHRLGT